MTVVGLLSGLTSCAPDYETEFNVVKLVVPDKSQAPIVFPLAGGESEIVVQTDVPFGKWTAVSNAEWCKVTPETNRVLVSANENNIYKQRRAEIKISYGHQSYSITVTQFGLEPAILIGDEMSPDGYLKEIAPELKMLSIPVTTNLDLDNIIIPDTCSWVRLAEEPKESKSVRAENLLQKELKFDLDQNTDTVVRFCTVILQSSQNYSYTNTLVIKQQKRGYIVEIDESNKVFEVKAMGGVITVPFKVNGPLNASYKFEIEESAKSWIKSAPATRGMRDKAEDFVISANTDVIESPREGKITFSSTDPKAPNQFVVTVKQAGFVPAPPVNVANATATPGAGFIRLQWEIPADVDYSKVEITYYDQVLKENKKFVINDYKTTSYVVNDTYQCAGNYEFTFTTYGPTGMVTQNVVTVTGTSGIAPGVERVTLTPGMLSANATEPTEGKLEYLVDNSTGTTQYYHTMWSQVQPNKEAHYVQIALTQPLQNLRFEYDSRRNGDGGGDVKRAGIWGTNNANDNDSWEKMGTLTFNMPTSLGGHATPTGNVEGRQAYKYIRFIPEARRSKDPLVATNKNDSWWNMAKMYLYRVRHDEAWAQEQLGK